MELLEWDAQSYDALPLPHKRWGPHTISRLRLNGDETVADIGCGTGRDAEHLLQVLPRGRVLAIDGSQQMLAQTRRRLASQLDRVEIAQADLRDPAPAGLAIHPPVDAALSVATLHWLPDHAQVFRTVAGLLKPGGQFVAEAGGAGNVASILAVLRDLGAGDGTGIWNFAGVPETTSRLAAAGFDAIEVDLVPDPARLDAGRQLEAYLATVVLGAHLRELSPPDRPPFVRAVAAHLAEPVVDYVRLRIRATRPGNPGDPARARHRPRASPMPKCPAWIPRSPGRPGLARCPDCSSRISPGCWPARTAPCCWPTWAPT